MQGKLMPLVCESHIDQLPPVSRAADSLALPGGALRRRRRAARARVGDALAICAILQAVPHAAHAGALDTDCQVRLEKLALRVVASAPMRAAVTRLEQLYAQDPQGRTPAGRATIQRAVDSIAFAAAQYTVNDDPARPCALWVVNAPHAWFGLEVPRSGYGIDNPDNVYRNIPVDAASRYQIRGKLRHPGVAEQHFALMDTIPGTTALTAEGGKVVASLRSDQMTIASDGSFTITVDSSAAGGRANHIEVPAGGTYLMIVRDLLTDWATQHPVALEVLRLPGPPLPPPSDEAATALRAANLLSRIGPYWLAYDNRFIYSRPANQVTPPRHRPGGRGFSASGHFKLAENEALVVTLDPLGAASLGFQLTDPWGVAYEYAKRTSSLNMAQAKPNQDGTYTYVIAASDPGVHNWLDTEGFGSGMFAIRWQALPPGTADDRAVRSAQVVKMGDLKSVLPAGTSFVTPAQRQLQQAERASSYARRLAE